MSKYVCITGMGHYHPGTVLDNKFYEQLGFDTSAEWITDRTGILERRSVLSQETILKLSRNETNFKELFDSKQIPTLANLSKPALELLLERKKEIKEDAIKKISFVLAGTSTPDYDLPANACSIAGELGISVPSFDVNSACSAFIVGLMVGKSLLQTGEGNGFLLFNVERLTTRISYQDRSSCILFGDAASVAMVEFSEQPKGLVLVDLLVRSTPGDYAQVQLPEAGYFSQNGKVVQKFAITRTVEITKEILTRNNLTTKDIGHFIAHQANQRMLTSVDERLEFATEQHWYNVDYFGNQGGTGAPATLSMNWSKIKPGENIVISVVGAGLTWASALFKAY